MAQQAVVRTRSHIGNGIQRMRWRTYPVFVTGFIAFCHGTHVQVQSRVTIIMMSPSPHDSLSIVPSTTSASSPKVEHVSDMSDLDDSEPEDDLSPILNALIVSSVKKYTCFHH